MNATIGKSSQPHTVTSSGNQLEWVSNNFPTDSCQTSNFDILQASVAVFEQRRPKIAIQTGQYHYVNMLKSAKTRKIFFTTIDGGLRVIGGCSQASKKVN